MSETLRKIQMNIKRTFYSEAIMFSLLNKVEKRKRNEKEEEMERSLL